MWNSCITACLTDYWFHIIANEILASQYHICAALNILYLCEFIFVNHSDFSELTSDTDNKTIKAICNRSIHTIRNNKEIKSIKGQTNFLLVYLMKTLSKSTQTASYKNKNGAIIENN